jgi:hypothetical protein
MSQQSPFEVSLRPVASQARWWIVGMVFLILGAWELTFHLWMMDLPMLLGHRLNALIGAALVAGVVLATFALIQSYEQRLAAAVRALTEKNEALRALEAERDSRLVDLAGDLSLALAEIVDECEVALSLPTKNSTPETLTAVQARAKKLGGVVHSLVELRQQGDSLTRSLPAILEEYQRYREAHPRPPTAAGGRAARGGREAASIGPPDSRP